MALQERLTTSIFFSFGTSSCFPTVLVLSLNEGAGNSIRLLMDCYMDRSLAIFWETHGVV